VGTPVVFEAAATVHIAATALDSTHAAIAYADGGNGGFGTAIIAATDGATTITSFGVAVVFESATVSNMAATTLDATHPAFAYTDGGNSDHGTAIVAETNGATTLNSFGSAAVFETAATTSISAVALDSTHLAIAYGDLGNSGHGTVIIGATNGATTITGAGAAVVFEAATTNEISITRHDATHFSIAYQDGGNSNYGTAIVGVTDGAVAVNSLGAAVVYEAAGVSEVSATALSATQLAITYADMGNGWHGTARVGDITGTTIAFPDPATVFESASSTYVFSTALNATSFVTAFQDNGNSNYGTAVVGVLGFANGVACAVGGDCLSTFCVDGVCCDTACAGGTTDCQACSTAAGAAANGTCGIASSGTVCRTATGICDIADYCSGVGTTCTANASLPNGTPCADDGLACNGVSVCSGGGCYAGTGVDCDDQNECTTDSCVEPAGTCTNTDVANGTACSGGVCGEGACVAIVADAGVDTGTQPVDAAGTPDTLVATPDTVTIALDTVIAAPDTVVVIPDPDAAIIADAAVDTLVILPPDTTSPPTADATADTLLDSAPPVADSVIPTADSTVDAVVTSPDATIDTVLSGDSTVDSTLPLDADPTADGETPADDATSEDATGGTGGTGGTAGTGGEGEGGCEGCTVGENSVPDAGTLLWGLLLLGWIVRRRR
jgi:uncharacterized protein (TIGR03382 family)